jgi:hypothetical protein
MKTAEELLAELVADVHPPKDCPIKPKEWPADALSIRNWMAIRDDMPDAERERFDKKVAQLCQTDPYIDWSAVNEREDSRRAIHYLEQES